MKKNLQMNEPMKRAFFNGGISFKREAGGEEEADSRVLELSFSSEEPYKRWWWGEEILLHEADSVNMTRLQEIGVVLYNHNRDSVIGKILSVEMDSENHKCRASIELDRDELSEWVFQKIKNGTLKGVSVGYSIDEFYELEEDQTSVDGRFQGPAIVATKWTPYEVSIVSVPADPTVGVGRQLGNTQEGDVKNMVNENEKAKQNEPVTEPVGRNTAEQARMDGAKAERQRVQEISAMCKQFDVSPDSFINEGVSVEKARSVIMEELAQRMKAVNVTTVADESDKFRAAAIDGFAMRAGVAINKPAAGADEFRGKRMLRLAAECVERFKNISTSNMDDETIIREALTGTGQFTGILSNVAHKSMAQSYQSAPTTFQLWTSKGSNSDFKKATRYRLSEADELVKLNENGEFKHAEVTEAEATASIATYGRSFSLTRQAIINDDMGALSVIPSLYGAAARRMINKMVYTILTGNPAIEGAALFDKKHNNLSAVDISIEGIATMKTLMARQKNIGGKETLNIQPAYIIVPPELEVTAAQLISSVVDPTKANATPNPFANRLTVISDPVLTNAKEWYLAAASGYCPTVEVTYLNGNEAPTMESAVQFDTLGIKWRIYHDVGVNLLDYRGLQKSTGKA